MNIRCLWAFAAAVFPFRVAAQDWHVGLCQASVDASLSFPVAGVLSRIVRQEGESVNAGDVILELESELEALEVTRQLLAVDAAKKATVNRCCG